MKQLLLAATAVTALGFAAPASAALMVGSTSVDFIGVAPVPASADLFSAVAVNLTSSMFGAGTGDYTSVPALTAIADSVMTMGSLGSYVFSSADGSFQATAGHVTGHTGSAASGSETLSLYFLGSFNTAGTTAGFSNSPASLTVSFTETASGSITSGNLGSFSASATLASPPTPISTPEPAAIALFGVGLLGLGFVRRRA